jgi:hypothetical protein
MSTSRSAHAMWQGALRGLEDSNRAAVADYIDRREPITVELLHSDHCPAVVENASAVIAMTAATATPAIAGRLRSGHGNGEAADAVKPV